MLKLSVVSLTAAAVIACLRSSHAFLNPQSHLATRIHPGPSTRVVTFMSDIPQDETDQTKTTKRRPPQNDDKEPMYSWEQLTTGLYKQLPGPPEDQLTLFGDISSLFIYGFTNHMMNEFFLRGLLDSSDSAEAAAKVLAPSDVSMATSSPVWLDHVALGPQLADHVVFNDLVDKLTPHFSPILSTAGLASVSMATCWLLAGYLHGAFSFRNTLDCPTERAVVVAGQTWVTSTILMILLACSSHFIMGSEAAQFATAEMMGSSQGGTSLEQWIGVLSRADVEFIFGSLGILTLWRFLISSLLGGWSKH